MLLVTGCGKLGSDSPDIAVVKWQEVVQSHSQYNKALQLRKDITNAQNMRNRQLVMGQKQLKSLGEMQKLRVKTKINYLQAEMTTRLAELNMHLKDQLKAIAKKYETAASQEVAGKVQQVEDAYRLPITNLRLKLANLSLSVDGKETVEQELQTLEQAKTRDLAGVENLRQQIINQKMMPEAQALQQKMQEQAVEIQKGIMEKNVVDQKKSNKAWVEAPKQLEKLIASMDKQIANKKAEHDKVLNGIDEDINNVLTKIMTEHKYTLILRDVKSNISAKDITKQVQDEIKILGN